MNKSVVVDARWDGNFGIGRFGREVRARLDDQFVPFRSDVSALSPQGILELRRRLSSGAEDTFYSPAFTGTLPIRGVRQLLTVFDLIHLDEPSESSLIKRAYYELVVAPAVRRSGWVATSSVYSEQRIRDWMGKRGDDLHVEIVGCGVSAAFKPPVADDFDPAHFVMVSNLGSHKNASTVLTAIAAQSEHRLTWVVSDHENAQKMIASYGADDRVTVRSGLSDSDLAALYGSAAALVFPSKIEGFGLPPVEAMSCGVPVIYSPMCAAAEETSGSVAGNVRVDDVMSAQQWAEAMEFVARNPRRVSEHGDIRGQFSWDVVASNVVSSLAAAVSNEP